MRKPLGYWQAWSNFEAELKEAIKENGGKFPVSLQLNKRRGLLHAFNYYGGMDAVREKMGYEPRTFKPAGYWQSWDNFEAELREAIEENGGKFPTSAKLVKMKKTGLLNSLFQYHGGINAVREKMGYERTRSSKSVRKPNGYWNIWENTKAELERIIEDNSGKFPTQRELMKMRESSLSYALKHHGGVDAVRERMGFEIKKRPKGYWQRWENVKAELKEVTKENGGKFPGSGELAKMGRRDLLNAFYYHGGINAIRERMGYGPGKFKPAGYWESWENVERELSDAIRENGGKFPVSSQLKKMGKGSLSNAIKNYGGINAIRERMGYEVLKKSYGYWQTWENFESELREAIKENKGEFPVGSQLIEMGRADLLAMFHYHGRIDAVREKMGYEQERKPIGYWQSWDNLERELREAIEDNGGEFPTYKKFREMKKYSLLGAFLYHGGINAVRERMGYDAEIKTPEQFMNLLKKDETARNLMGVAAMLNGQSRDVERIIAEIYDGKIKDRAAIHSFLQEHREEIYELIRDGLTNLGQYIGGFSLHERKIFPVLMGQVIASIPEEKISSLEDRLVRLLKINYSPRFNLQPEETLAELTERIKSFEGRRREVYQNLYNHYQEVLRLGEELS